MNRQSTLRLARLLVAVRGVPAWLAEQLARPCMKFSHLAASQRWTVHSCDVFGSSGQKELVPTESPRRPLFAFWRAQKCQQNCIPFSHPQIQHLRREGKCFSLPAPMPQPSLGQTSGIWKWCRPVRLSRVPSFRGIRCWASGAAIDTLLVCWTLFYGLHKSGSSRWSASHAARRL